MLELIEELKRDGYEPYLTSVGGSGLGVLSPYAQLSGTLGQLTPPETPFESSRNTSSEGDSSHVSHLQDKFKSTTTLDLSNWADGLGRWLYV